MDKRIIIGAVAGFIIGLLESFLLTEGASFGDSFTNIITIMSTLLGLIIGFASTKVSPKRNFYIASAVLGALFFIVVAVKSGLYFDDVFTGAVTGLVIGFLADKIGEKMAV